MEATLTETARSAISTLVGADPNLRESPNRDLGREANQARKKQPSEEAAVEQQRAQVAEQERQERLQRETTQAAERGETRQSPEQEAAGRKQNTPQQTQTKTTSLMTRAWQMVLHHVPKKIMGLARAMGLSVDYAEAVGAAKNGVDTAREVASQAKHHGGQDPFSQKPDATPQRGGEGPKKDTGRAA